MLKMIHISTAFISILLFLLRGYLHFSHTQTKGKFLKIAPHANDTILLITALLLALQIQQYPLSHHWLTAKVVALLIYIGLGMVALHSSQSRGIQVVAWVLAIIVFGYIVGVAINRSALLWF